MAGKQYSPDYYSHFDVLGDTFSLPLSACSAAGFCDLSSAGAFSASNFPCAAAIGVTPGGRFFGAAIAAAIASVGPLPCATAIGVSPPGNGGIGTPGGIM